MLRDKREREDFDKFNDNEEHPGAGYVTIASNVASACRFLHDMGFLHRDLKVRRICCARPSRRMRHHFLY